MDEDIKNLLLHIEHATHEAQNIASGIARGTGGREVALTITKLQEATMWLEMAQELIEARNARGIQ